MNDIGKTFTKELLEADGFSLVAETYISAGIVRVYKYDKVRGFTQAFYLSTTDNILRQCGMDGDTLARYLCHISNDTNSIAFKEMMHG